MEKSEQLPAWNDVCWNLSAGVVKINDLYLSFFVDINQFFVVIFHMVYNKFVHAAICYV